MLPTADTLVAAMGVTPNVACVWAPHLALACKTYEIDTAPRLAAFLAQIGHESASFSRLVEGLNYSAAGLRATWPHRFPAATAEQYARQPEKIANRVYGGRMGNGPEATGDGYKYRGRGLIQNTGRANYEDITDTLRENFADCPDFVESPNLLTLPRWAALSAAAYWDDHYLNALADVGSFDGITQRINGGQTGAADRLARYQRAKRALT